MGRGGLGSLRIDKVPSYLSPIINSYGWTGATVWSSTLEYLRKSCHWKFIHSNDIGGQYDGEDRRYFKPCLHVAWHECVPAYMCSYMIDKSLPHHHIWLQHPAVYMAPIHTLLTTYNVDYVLGSSGHGGQVALESVKTLLVEAHGSSAFFPDGPSGPLKQVKPGVVQLAKETGLPIVPIRFEFTDSWRIGWDQKHIPKPGSTITIYELDPIFVKPDTDLKVATKDLQTKLME